MRLLIRADSSSLMGTGHVMRCLALALELREQGCEVSFAAAELTDGISALLEKEAFATIPLSHTTSLGELGRFTAQPCDWLIVDHYGLDAKWESEARRYSRRILVIDDLPNRRHDCDGLLVAHLLNEDDRRFDRLVPQGCRKLFGPRFALLRREFHTARQAPAIPGQGPPVRVFVSLGGVDSGNETAKVVRGLALVAEQRPLVVDVVVGLANPYRHDLADAISSLSGFTLHVQPPSIVQVMRGAILSVSAGGISVFERLTMGIANIAISIAENQTAILEEYGQAGYLRYLGESGAVSADQIATAVIDLLANKTELVSLGRRGATLVDGLGARRVAEMMLS